MTTISEHYNHHLGRIYSWMIGDIEAAVERSAAELDAIGLPAVRAGIALDLGAGIGLHALPLARRGYAVTAIDGCQQLLDELRSRSGALPIATVTADILAFPGWLQRPADAILCMGDTLTHLPDVASVELLLTKVARALAMGGMFACTFRDYVSAPLTADQRFILVRSDDKRILTCFLEYFEHKVVVHDLLQQWENGCWQQTVSSYPKLRLAPEWVASQLVKHGLEVRQSAGPGGMVCIAATRTQSAAAALSA
jgi:SAM-dependent methyltransferase